MTSRLSILYELRERLVQFYARHGLYVRLLTRFLAAYIMVTAIHSQTGYAEFLDSILMRLLTALVCSVLPWSIMTFVLGLILVYEMFKVSLIVSMVALVLLLIMLLLNVIFAPGCEMIVFLVPAAFFLKVPFLVPLLAGLCAPLTSILPLIFGLIIYYMNSYVKGAAGILSDATGAEEAIQKFMSLIQGIVNNREAVIIIASFVVTTVVVFLIRTMFIDYAWYLAILIGAVANIVLILFGKVGSSSSMTTAYIIGSSLVSVLIAMVVQFLRIAADFKHSELAQFEDDEYYYYVKAVPKVHISVAPLRPSKAVKDSQRGQDGLNDDTLTRDLAEDKDE